MGAAIKAVSSEQRLKVVAAYNHRTVTYQGDIFAFIAMLQDEGWSGKGTFSVNQGRDFFAMEFDFREKDKQKAVDVAGG